MPTRRDFLHGGLAVAGLMLLPGFPVIARIRDHSVDLDSPTAVALGATKVASLTTDPKTDRRIVEVTDLTTGEVARHALDPDFHARCVAVIGAEVVVAGGFPIMVDSYEFESGDYLAERPAALADEPAIDELLEVTTNRAEIMTYRPAVFAVGTSLRPVEVSQGWLGDIGGQVTHILPSRPLIVIGEAMGGFGLETAYELVVGTAATALGQWKVKRRDRIMRPPFPHPSVTASSTDSLGNHTVAITTRAQAFLSDIDPNGRVNQVRPGPALDTEAGEVVIGFDGDGSLVTVDVSGLPATHRPSGDRWVRNTNQVASFVGTDGSRHELEFGGR